MVFGFEMQAKETVNLIAFQKTDSVKTCCTAKIPSRYGIKKKQSEEVRTVMMKRITVKAR